jgi:hypothetical protein
MERVSQSPDRRMRRLRANPWHSTFVHVRITSWKRFDPNAELIRLFMPGRSSLVLPISVASDSKAYFPEEAIGLSKKHVMAAKDVMAHRRSHCVTGRYGSRGLHEFFVKVVARGWWGGAPGRGGARRIPDRATDLPHGLIRASIWRQ